jgi:hypothetical protein
MEYGHGPITEPSPGRASSLLRRTGLSRWRLLLLGKAQLLLEAIFALLHLIRMLLSELLCFFFELVKIRHDPLIPLPRSADAPGGLFLGGLRVDMTAGRGVVSTG